MIGALSLSYSYFYHHENVLCGENTSRIKHGSRDAWQGFYQCHHHFIIVEPRLFYFLAGLLTDRPAGWNALGSSVRNVLNAPWTEKAQETRSQMHRVQPWEGSSTNSHCPPQTTLLSSSRWAPKETIRLMYFGQWLCIDTPQIQLIVAKEI